MVSFLKKNKKSLMFIVGLAITAVSLWYTTRQVVLKDFIAEMKSFNYVWLIPAFIVFYYSMYLRAVRWGLLFRPHHHIKGYEAFAPLMICFGFNGLLPGRVGEVARAYVIGTRKKTGVPTALATVVAERILDAATLMGLLAFSLSVLPKVDPAMKVDIWGYSVSGLQFNQLKVKIVILSAILVIGVIVFMIRLTQIVMHAVIDALPLVSVKFRGQLHKTLEHFAMGFHALQQPWVLAQIAFHSLVLWVMIGISNQMVARGFGLHMSLAQAEAQMVMIGIFITIPAAPGYWGLYEAGTIFSMLVLRIVPATSQGQSLALAYSLMIHLLQYVPIVIAGLYFAWKMQLKPAAMTEIEEKA